MCSFNRVLTGRCHSGDENGKTWFEDAELEAVDEICVTRMKEGVNEQTLFLTELLEDVVRSRHS